VYRTSLLDAITIILFAAAHVLLPHYVLGRPSVLLL
jgi:hypothetical protein